MCRQFNPAPRHKTVFERRLRFFNPVFSPAYDLVATALVNPADDEDLALTLNGKKKKINYNDFIAAFNTLGLDAKQQENIFKKMEKAKPIWLDFIDKSFLHNEMKVAYKNLIQNRFARLYPTTTNEQPPTKA